MQKYGIKDTHSAHGRTAHLIRELQIFIREKISPSICGLDTVRFQLLFIIFSTYHIDINCQKWLGIERQDSKIKERGREIRSAYHRNLVCHVTYSSVLFRFLGLKLEYSNNCRVVLGLHRTGNYYFSAQEGRKSVWDLQPRIAAKTV